MSERVSIENRKERWQGCGGEKARESGVEKNKNRGEEGERWGGLAPRGSRVEGGWEGSVKPAKKGLERSVLERGKRQVYGSGEEADLGAESV